MLDGACEYIVDGIDALQVVGRVLAAENVRPNDLGEVRSVHAIELAAARDDVQQATELLEHGGVDLGDSLQHCLEHLLLLFPVLLCSPPSIELVGQPPDRGDEETCEREAESVPAIDLTASNSSYVSNGSGSSRRNCFNRPGMTPAGSSLLKLLMVPLLRPSVSSIIRFLAPAMRNTPSDSSSAPMREGGEESERVVMRLDLTRVSNCTSCDHVHDGSLEEPRQDARRAGELDVDLEQPLGSHSEYQVLAALLGSAGSLLLGLLQTQRRRVRHVLHGRHGRELDERRELLGREVQRIALDAKVLESVHRCQLRMHTQIQSSARIAGQEGRTNGASRVNVQFVGPVPPSQARLGCDCSRDRGSAGARA